MRLPASYLSAPLTRRWPETTVKRDFEEVCRRNKTVDAMVKVSRKSPCGIAFLAISLLNGWAAPDHFGSNAVPSGPGPGPRFTEPLTTVETLKPSFAWTATATPDVSYDLIICVGNLNNDGVWVPGKAAYYRESLPTTTHTLGQPLLPNTVYVWSVRCRSGKRTSKWAAYNDANPSLFPRSRLQYDIFLPFKTPGN
jgi:hypothetical protein